MRYYLAVDIGASSGRHILGHTEDGKMILEEVYRFKNGLVERNGHKCWDREALFGHILAGIRKCKEIGKIPETMGIDTWGVDFVLIDAEGKEVGDAVGYRDDRTDGMDEALYRIIPQHALYERTGIQKAIFNTVYQMMALKKQNPEQLDKAERMLLTPEYYSYLLTGVCASEYTNATTTQLVNARTRDWDYELIEKMGLPRRIFGKLQMPGSVVGNFKKEIREAVGFDCTVLLPATHDTASAVIAVPTNAEHTVYISSGTWSLMGTELPEPDCSAESEAHNFTNEGGYDYRFRYLKNIMGMWMINTARAELAPEMSFSEICEEAEKASIESLVPANDARFLAPESMYEEVRNCCAESGQQVPEGMAETAKVIYRSLAACYAETAAEIEEMTGVHADCIHIVGGGSNADYLNRLTAKACGRTVYTGPTEGTAIGNIAVQLIRSGEVKNLTEAREMIFRSFPIGEYR